MCKIKIEKTEKKGHTVKKISLETIQKNHRFQSYEELYHYILKQMESSHLKPVIASKTNGKKPALYNTYWILDEPKDHTSLIEELNYQIVPAISVNYYLRNLTHYEQDREWVLLLNDYLKNKREKLEQPESINERSFEIWQREKFLKEEQGRKILSRCKIDPEMLNVYDTAEPFACYTHSRNTPQNILILENKDTFYSMRKHLLEGKVTILGCKFGTLIYGGGKRILKSFQDFALCAEPYLQQEDNRIYYFGDLDYEGIGIYEKLAELFEKTGKIEPFVHGYTGMIEKYENQKLKLPPTKEKQNRNISGLFYTFFTEKQKAQMTEILEKGLYIPQEILNIHDL